MKFKLKTLILSRFAERRHQSMLVDTRVQQAMVEYLRRGDVSKTKIALPPLKFNNIE